MSISLNRYAVLAAVLSLIAMPSLATAQELVAAPPQPDQQFAPPPQAAPQAPVAQAPVYTQAQIDQMLAPIALYPDQLVGQILMASTYPLEVVEAGRWLQDPSNAALQGDQLAAAMQQQNWDPSVKSLVAFPQVVKMMDSNLQWTEQVGDAFLAQQNDVMGEVQHLRQQAQASGNLNSTPQETVATQGSSIVIEPAQPQVVYVPVYNPNVVYGPWLYPAYPPFYFPSYYFPGTVFVGGAVIGFGIGVAIIGPLWGWWHWDWYNHHIDIDADRFHELGGHPFAGGVWAHDVDHRRGVPYRDAATRSHFLGAAANSPEARRTFRGFPAATSGHTAQFNNNMRAAGFNSNTHAVAGGTQRSFTGAQQRPAAAMQQYPAAAPAAQRPAYMQRSYTAQPQRTAPMYESYARGAEVQAQSARGAASRMSAASFRAPAPAMRQAVPARSSGGNGGGRNDFRQH